MHVGVCRVRLHLPGSQSLKDKRQVIKSLTARVKNDFNVSICEIEERDLWQIAVLGITCAGMDVGRIREFLYRVADFISSNGYEAEVTECEVDVASVFDS